MKRFMSIVLAGLLTCSIAGAQTYSKNLEKQAKGGDVEAMVELGDAYKAGNGTSKNIDKAAKWYKKAAEKESVAGCRRMAELYTSWDALEKNPEQEDYWLRKAALAGDAELALKYGKAYLKGEDGQERSYDLACDYLRQAIKQSDSDKEASGYMAYALVKSPKYRNYFYAISLAKDLDKADVSDESRKMGRNATNMAYASLGLHDKVSLSRLDDSDVVIYCTALKITDLYSSSDEVKILKEVKEIEYAGHNPYFTYLKGIGCYVSGRYDMAIDFFKKAFDGGVEEAGVALVGLNHNRQRSLNIAHCADFVANEPTLRGLTRHLNGRILRLDADLPQLENEVWKKMSSSNNDDLRGNSLSEDEIKGVRTRWAERGNLDAIRYLTKEYNAEVDKYNRHKRATEKEKERISLFDMINELGAFPFLGQNGDWSAVKLMHLDTKAKGRQADADMWMERLQMRYPVSTAEGCAYLYNEIYKNNGEESEIEFVDMLARKDPRYVLNWVSQDSKIGKSKAINFLRQAAMGADSSVREEFDDYLRNRYGVAL